MQIAITLLVFAFIISGAIYAVNLYSLYQIVKLEAPELLATEAPPSIFYSGMPRGADPNVGYRLLSIAYSSKVYSLKAPTAVKYSRNIRFSLPVGAIFFSCLLICIYVQSVP